VKAPSHCPTCGAKTVEYRHNLSKGLAGALIALHEAGGKFNVNELPLTHNQKANFQKLRYWELVEKTDRPDGSHIGGWWEITGHGSDFLLGFSIQKHVWTYRGNPIRTEGEYVTIEDLSAGYKYRPQYAEEAQPRLL